MIAKALKKKRYFFFTSALADVEEFSGWSCLISGYKERRKEGGAPHYS